MCATYFVTLSFLAPQLTTSTESDTAATPRKTQQISPEKSVPDIEKREAVAADAAAPLEGDEVLHEHAGEREGVHGTDEHPQLSADEIENVEDSETVAIDGELKEQKEAGIQDEDIYMWIEDVRRFVQS